MRGLCARRTRFAFFIHANANEVPPIRIIDKRQRNDGGARRGQNLARPLQAKQGRRHEQKKGHQCGYRISGNAEKAFAVAPSKEKGFPGPNGDAPKINLAAQLGESFANKVQFSNRNAAAGDDDIAFLNRPFQSGLCGLEFVRNQWEFFWNAAGS
jgi:hypothetical protein